MPGECTLRAQRFGQPVVAPAAQHRILRAQRAVDHFERGAHVVIQAAHQPRAHLVCDAAIVEVLLHRVEMRAARVAEVIDDARQLLDDGLVRFHFAIQHAQRIGFGAALAIAAHPRRHRFQLLPQALDVLRTAVAVAHRIDQQLETGEAGALEDLHHHLDHFGIHRGGFRADGLGADLVELPVAALLRALAAEHGAEVVELLHAGTLVEPVLDVGADHRSGVLRPQREGAAVAVLEGVHLLGDDVGFLAHAAREQLRLLEDGRADFVVVIGAKDRARRGFHAVPHLGGWRQ